MCFDHYVSIVSTTFSTNLRIICKAFCVGPCVDHVLAFRLWMLTSVFLFSFCVCACCCCCVCFQLFVRPCVDHVWHVVDHVSGFCLIIVSTMCRPCINHCCNHEWLCFYNLSDHMFEHLLTMFDHFSDHVLATVWSVSSTICLTIIQPLVRPCFRHML